MSREDLKQRGGGQLFWCWFCVFTRFWKIIQDTLLLCFPLMWSVMMTLTMMVMMTVVSSELRKLVAAGLWQTGYHAEWLWCGQDGGGEAQRSSSRGLLLALGWLLAEGALEKLLTQRVQQLDRTLLTPTQVGSNTSAKFSVHMSEMPTCVCVWASLSLSGVLSATRRLTDGRCLFEKTSVAHWLSEIPGSEPAVCAGRTCSATSCCEEILLLFGSTACIFRNQ